MLATLFQWSGLSLYVASSVKSQQKDGVSALQRDVAQTANSKALIPGRGMQSRQKGPEKLRSLCILHSISEYPDFVQLLPLQLGWNCLA